ncbi:MAG: 3-isopropylmalate dehydratase large subunit [Chloroflexi bacterium]|nr:3-isopropylmalate dehydratase large subunit [Chloroflexota bacterium]
MGKTIVEKILARAAGRTEVIPGDYMEVTSRCPVTVEARADGCRGWAHLVKGGVATRVFDPKMIHSVDGHTGSSASHRAGEVHRAQLEWAKAMGVPQENVYPLGRQGIENVFAGEHAWALPGEVSLLEEGHSTTLGALGAFAVTLSFGAAAYIRTGKTWIRVPETVKLVINGRLPQGVVARDIAEYVLAQVGPSGCVGQVMEWTGPVIDALDMDGRFCICSNALFTGAWTSIMSPDQKCLDYVRARNPQPLEPLYSDPDAQYAKVLTFDVSGLEPQVVPPPKRFTGQSVAAFEGTLINRGFVGSCENSRMEDMRLAAQVLKGRKLHPEVILNITPGTVNIYRQAMREGLLEIFAEAECVIPSPACGMCSGGAYTPLAAGDVCISTGTCNYPGRMGSQDAEIYLGNPATVAASCVEGRITDPRKYL